MLASESLVLRFVAGNTVRIVIVVVVVVVVSVVNSSCIIRFL